MRISFCEILVASSTGRCRNLRTSSVHTWKTPYLYRAQTSLCFIKNLAKFYGRECLWEIREPPYLVLVTRRYLEIFFWGTTKLKIEMTAIHPSSLFAVVVDLLSYSPSFCECCSLFTAKSSLQLLLAWRGRKSFLGGKACWTHGQGWAAIDRCCSVVVVVVYLVVCTWDIHIRHTIVYIYIPKNSMCPICIAPE